MEEMFQTVIAGYFIFCLQNRLWGYSTIATQTTSVIIELPVSITKKYGAFAQHSNSSNVTRTFAVSFQNQQLIVYVDTAPTVVAGFYWIALTA